MCVSFLRACFLCQCVDYLPYPFSLVLVPQCVLGLVTCSSSLLLSFWGTLLLGASLPCKRLPISGGDNQKLCGTIPSTGEPLEVKRFTLGNFYYLGCTNKKRQYLKDCTAEGVFAKLVLMRLCRRRCMQGTDQGVSYEQRGERMSTPISRLPSCSLPARSSL